MNLADILGAPPQQRVFYSAKVTATGTGKVTVHVAGSDQDARYVGSKPSVNDIVLVVFVADEPVCLGVFGTA